jgi:hypothetical protein
MSQGQQLGFQRCRRYYGGDQGYCDPYYGCNNGYAPSYGYAPGYGYGYGYGPADLPAGR